MNDFSIPVSEQEILILLSGKIGKSEISIVADWAEKSDKKREYLFDLSRSADRKCAVNALWVMTHLGENSGKHLQKKQSFIINMLLREKDTSKKRLLLQLLRRQEFDPDQDLTIMLLNWCFSKINSECEPYAVRCFSIYIAFKICQKYPELISELEQYLNLLTSQSISPGLKSALRQTKEKIRKLKYK